MRCADTIDVQFEDVTDHQFFFQTFQTLFCERTLQLLSPRRRPVPSKHDCNTEPFSSATIQIVKFLVST